MSAPTDRPLALLDAASLYFRSFFALPESLRAPDGTPVNAVRGFADTVARILVDRKPERLVACLDADWRPQFRVDLLPSYKAHRVAEEGADEATDGLVAEEVPDTLGPQVPIMLDLLEACGLATAEAAGYEADDVIGTLTARERTNPVEVVTGDRDLFQLVRTEPTPASVIYVGKGWAKADVLTPTDIAERYGVPETDAGAAYAAMAVLRGDPSDGLPGVTGIGEKTAAKLITRFGSLQGLLDAARDEHPDVPKRARTQLAAAADYLAVAPTVVAVVPDAPVTFSRDDRVPDSPADPERVAELAERWNLGGSVDRLLAALGG